MLEHSQSISIEAMLSSKHPDWALSWRMLFKGQQWERFVEMLCKYRWICVEAQRWYQHSKLWDITVRRCAKCFSTLLHWILLTVLGIMWHHPHFPYEKTEDLRHLPLCIYEERPLMVCWHSYQNQINLLRAKYNRVSNLQCGYMRPVQKVSSYVIWKIETFTEEDIWYKKHCI